MDYTPSSEDESRYLEEYDPSKYPVNMMTADIIVYTDTHVLLIERGGHPYKGYWALPGGFINQDETAAYAAMRELDEETGVHVEKIDFMGYSDNPTRDPRGRVVSFIFAHYVEEMFPPKPSDDATQACWFPVTHLPRLAFDHKKILQRVFEEE